MKNNIEDIINSVFREVMEWDSNEDMDDSMSSENVDEWDSLVTMALFIRIEKIFEIKFEYDDVIKMNTLGDIKKIVIKKIGEK